ncbi:MAG: hypothetical protein ACREFY_15375, partial [Acetobacteraceae bacterium]
CWARIASGSGREGAMTARRRTECVRGWTGPAAAPADIAVVIPTIGRASLLRAVRSVFAQDFTGSIQILVGIDRDVSGRASRHRTALAAELPANMQLTWFDPSYSTSCRYGGVNTCRFGGALRTILTFAAQPAIVLYLDDDDWYAPSHVRAMAAAMEGRQWAFSLCWYADSDLGIALWPDEIESVGPGRGVYAERFGGFVRPSALAIDKLALAPILHLWSQSDLPEGDGEDRLIFEQLLQAPAPGETGQPTVFYAVDPRDRAHRRRAEFLERNGVSFTATGKRESLRPE